MDIQNIVAGLVQRVEQRFYGKYRGIVVDNADPEHLGRLKANVPSVLGTDVVTGWALPCMPYGGDADQGFLFIPEVGAGVWVEFEEGDLEFPIWVGTFWSKPGGDSELPKPNKPDGSKDGSVQDPPTRKIIKTKQGHTIQLEDAAGSEAVMIMEAKNNNMVLMNQEGIKITDGANGNEITLNVSGIKITDGANGNEITLNGTSGFPSGKGIVLNGDKRICLEGLIVWLLKHQHVGNMGAPTPLFPADLAELAILGAVDQEILSKTVKAE